MFSEEETQALIRDCIEKVNARVTGNKPSVLLLKSCCVCGKEFQVHDCEDDSVLAPVEYTCPKCSESTDIA